MADGFDNFDDIDMGDFDAPDQKTMANKGAGPGKAPAPPKPAKDDWLEDIPEENDYHPLEKKPTVESKNLDKQTPKSNPLTPPTQALPPKPTPAQNSIQNASGAANPKPSMAAAGTQTQPPPLPPAQPTAAKEAKKPEPEKPKAPETERREQSRVEEPQSNRPVNQSVSNSAQNNNSQLPAAMGPLEAYEGFAQYYAALSDLDKEKLRLLYEKNTRLRQEIGVISKATEEIIQRDKAKKNHKGKYEHDEDVQSLNRVIKDQQVQIAAMKVKVEKKKKELDEAYQYPMVREKEDVLRDLRRQIADLLKDKEAAVKVRKEQAKAAGTAKEETKADDDRKNKLKEELDNLKRDYKILFEKKTENDKLLNKNHAKIVDGKMKVRDLEKKYEIYKQQKKPDDPELKYLSKETLDKVKEELADLEKARIARSAQHEEDMHHFEKLKAEIKKNNQKVERAIREKEKEMRLNIVRMKELRRLMRHKVVKPMPTTPEEIQEMLRQQDRDIQSRLDELNIEIEGGYRGSTEKENQEMIERRERELKRELEKLQRAKKEMEDQKEQEDDKEIEDEAAPSEVEGGGQGIGRQSPRPDSTTAPKNAEVKAQMKDAQIEALEEEPPREASAKKEAPSKPKESPRPTQVEEQTKVKAADTHPNKPKASNFEVVQEDSKRQTSAKDAKQQELDDLGDIFGPVQTTNKQSTQQPVEAKPAVSVAKPSFKPFSGVKPVVVTNNQAQVPAQVPIPATQPQPAQNTAPAQVAKPVITTAPKPVVVTSVSNNAQASPMQQSVAAPPKQEEMQKPQPAVIPKPIGGGIPKVIPGKSKPVIVDNSNNATPALGAQINKKPSNDGFIIGNLDDESEN